MGTGSCWRGLDRNGVRSGACIGTVAEAGELQRRAPRAAAPAPPPAGRGQQEGRRRVPPAKWGRCSNWSNLATRHPNHNFIA
jgi:hypothetical protein